MAISPTARRIGADCLCSPLRFLQRAVSGLYDEALRPFGIGMAQLNLLVAIESLGERAAPRTVAAALQLEKSSLSREVRHLEAQGWVRRPTARLAPIELTAAGRRLLERVEPAWERAQVRAAEVLGQRGRDLVALGQRLRAEALRSA